MGLTNSMSQIQIEVQAGCRFSININLHDSIFIHTAVTSKPLFSYNSRSGVVLENDVFRVVHEESVLDGMWKRFHIWCHRNCCLFHREQNCCQKWPIHPGPGCHIVVWTEMKKNRKLLVTLHYSSSFVVVKWWSFTWLSTSCDHTGYFCS